MGSSLSTRAHELYQRLRVVAQLLREAPPGKDPRLLWRDVGDRVQARAIEDDIIIGRDSSSDVVLSQPRVSRRHCRVWLENGQVWIEDLGSTAGIIVNGFRTSRHLVCDGDLLDVGGTVLTFAHAIEPEASGGGG